MCQRGDGVWRVVSVNLGVGVNLGLGIGLASR